MKYSIVSLAVFFSAHAFATTDFSSDITRAAVINAPYELVQQFEEQMNSGHLQAGAMAEFKSEAKFLLSQIMENRLELMAAATTESEQQSMLRSYECASSFYLYFLNKKYPDPTSYADSCNRDR